MAWHKLVEREGDFFKNVLLYEALEENFPKVFGRHHPPWLTTRQGDTFTHYHDQQKAQEFSFFLQEQVKNDPTFISRVVETGKQHFQELVQFCQTIEVEGKKEDELAELIKKYCSLYKQPYPYFVITPFADHSTDKDLIQVMGEWRLWARDKFNQVHKLVQPLFETIAARLHLSTKEIAFLTPQEIVQALHLHDRIQCRQQCYFLFQEGKYTLRDNESFIVKNDPLENKLQQNFVEKLHGQGTFPALVQGKVRVIRTSEQLAHLQEGEVAVMRMATPDLALSYLKKVSALVTDEGGITCHAAIISRELKKPCVIGTEIATVFFKDGDFVEVDAEKGIVRK